MLGLRHIDQKVRLQDRFGQGVASQLFPARYFDRGEVAFGSGVNKIGAPLAGYGGNAGNGKHLGCRAINGMFEYGNLSRTGFAAHFDHGSQEAGIGIGRLLGRTRPGDIGLEHHAAARRDETQGARGGNRGLQGFHGILVGADKDPSPVLFRDGGFACSGRGSLVAAASAHLGAAACQSRQADKFPSFHGSFPIGHCGPYFAFFRSCFAFASRASRNISVCVLPLSPPE